MPVKSALAGLFVSAAVQSKALVVWLLLTAPFLAALAPVCGWNTHFELFFKKSTASPLLLQLFFALPPVDSFHFFRGHAFHAFLSDFFSAASLSCDFFCLRRKSYTFFPT